MHPYCLESITDYQKLLKNYYQIIIKRLSLVEIAVAASAFSSTDRFPKRKKTTYNRVCSLRILMHSSIWFDTINMRLIMVLIKGHVFGVHQSPRIVVILLSSAYPF